MKTLKGQGFHFLKIFAIYSFLAYCTFSLEPNNKFVQERRILSANPRIYEVPSSYEKSDRKFMRIEIWDRIVYYHQRRIGEAIVEKDFISYQFDRDTKELLFKNEHWRADLPEYVAPIISGEQAELMAEGDLLFSKLYFISPESEIFPLIPAPENPCWVLRSIHNGNIIVTIIDAMTGDKLGYGIPPPYNAFALSGPMNQNPCTGAWYSWVWNAAEWFLKLGYSTPTPTWPHPISLCPKSEIEAYIKDPQTVVFYEIAHGDSDQFASGCKNDFYEWTSAWDIKTWMSSSPKKLLVFLWSCDAMVHSGPNTLSYEFRKGESTDTSVVGGYNMDSPGCESCWSNHRSWQDRFFQYLSKGRTQYEAFLLANIDYPLCFPCIKYEGDETIKEKSIYPPLNFSGSKFENRSLLQREYINVLTWDPNPKNVLPIDAYRIYEIEGEKWNLVDQLAATTYGYWHRNVKKDKRYLYMIASVFDNIESYPTYIEVY